MPFEFSPPEPVGRPDRPPKVPDRVPRSRGFHILRRDLTLGHRGLNIIITLIVETGYLRKMGSKSDLIFYAVAGNIIALIAGATGASLPVILFSALLIPPIMLIVFRIIR